MDGEDVSELRLDALSDHDLLVQIATRCECLPELQRRMDAAERDIARLQVESRIATAIGSLVAGVVGVFVKPGG